MSTISFDNPILSPVLDALPAPWELSTSLNINDSFTHYFAPSNSTTPGPETSLATTPALKTDSLQSDQQLCIPPAQVFSISTDQKPQSPAVAADLTPKPERGRLSISINPSVVAAATAAAKRSASPAPTASVKRQRTTERVNSKDFIPPDVTGLSKREARLVKNRAAAFLSRQRKREEFELMEVRVAELEQENARLLALARGGSVPSISSSSSENSEELVSQIEQLKADLAAAQEREKQLSAQLQERASEAPIFQQPVEPEMKVEHLEPAALSQALATRPQTSKSAASLGLMVLLCALPTLLSMPNTMRSTLPSSYEPFPASSSSSFDFNSILTSDYDWSSLNPTSGMMDLDDDLDFTNPFTTEEPLDTTSSVPVQSVQSFATTPQKLEFSASDLPEELIAAAESEGNGLSLAGLDISFDAKPEDGKIRVRIHTSSNGSAASTSVNSRASSPGVSELAESTPSQLEQFRYPTAMELAQSPKEIPSLGHLASALPSPSPSALGDPFLGVGSSPDDDFNDFSASYFNSRASGDSLMFDDFGTGLEYSYSGSSPSGKDSTMKRVRIALKSLPSAGGEGGEWEVQVC